jgi:hypothetical protein
MPVKKGLATWAGIVAAVAQYLAAVAVFLEADNQSDALGPLVTATATLLAVIVGRMQQAKAQIEKQTPLQTLGRQAATMGMTTSTSTATPYVTWGTGGPTPATKPGEFDREPGTPPEAELRDLHENEQS